MVQKQIFTLKQDSWDLVFVLRFVEAFIFIWRSWNFLTQNYLGTKGLKYILMFWGACCYREPSLEAYL